MGTQKIFTMKAMFVVMLAVCAVAFAEEVADQNTDEQFLTTFRYGYPYASAGYLASAPPVKYTTPTVKYTTPTVKYTAPVSPYTYTAGAYPYTYPSTYAVRSFGPARYVAGSFPFTYTY